MERGLSIQKESWWCQKQEGEKKMGLQDGWSCSGVGMIYRWRGLTNVNERVKGQTGWWKMERGEDWLEKYLMKVVYMKSEIIYQSKEPLPKNDKKMHLGGSVGERIGCGEGMRWRVMGLEWDRKEILRKRRNGSLVYRRGCRRERVWHERFYEKIISLCSK